MDVVAVAAVAAAADGTTADGTTGVANITSGATTGAGVPDSSGGDRLAINSFKF